MNNISPIDGRYKRYTQELNELFSENALIKARLIIEVKYFIFLSELNTPNFLYNKTLCDYLDKYCDEMLDDDISEIKKIEDRINHDVKSIEYYLSEVLKIYDREDYINLLHFGLTSQDVNTMVYSLSLKNFNNSIFTPNFDKLLASLKTQIDTWNKIVIIGRTHGQPATWTLLGKEFNVFKAKLVEEMKFINDYKFTTKFGGAVGNMTSHKLFANLDWSTILNNFVEEFGLIRSEVTTQIHNYNEYARYFDGLKRICSILIDMCVDIWLYCSFGELTLNKPKEQVGSSIMPHKVNPIEFENAEGNLKIAEMWLEFMSRELCKSRLQRDLTDSTILRNLGVVFGHLLIGMKNICKGLTYLVVDEDKIEEHLLENLSSMSERDQHILRKVNNVSGYDTVKKELTEKTEAEYNIPDLCAKVDYYKHFILTDT
jgi:adenylosuccinate lyase